MEIFEDCSQRRSSLQRQPGLELQHSVVPSTLYTSKTGDLGQLNHFPLLGWLKEDARPLNRSCFRHNPTIG